MKTRGITKCYRCMANMSCNRHRRADRRRRAPLRRMKLRAAIYANDVIELKRLLDNGADPLEGYDRVVPDTPLHKAVELNNVRAAKLLIEADPRALRIVDYNGHTPYELLNILAPVGFNADFSAMNDLFEDYGEDIPLSLPDIDDLAEYLGAVLDSPPTLEHLDEAETRCSFLSALGSP